MTQVALAKSPVKGKVLPLKIMSDVLDEKRVIALTTVLSEKLRAYPRHQVLDPPVADVLELLMEFDCVDPDGECMRQIGSKNKALAVVFVSVTKEKKKYVLTYKTYDVKTGKEIGGGASTTTTLSALPSALEKGVGSMFGAPPSPEPAPVGLVVTATAPGARVFLNNRDLGPVPVSTKVLPGKNRTGRSYTLRVEKKGYEVFREDVVAKAGAAVKVHAKMKAIKIVTIETKEEKKVDPKKTGVTQLPTPVTAKTPIYQKWWFWTASSVVVLGAVTAVLLAMNSGPDGSSGGLLISLDPAQVENDAVFRNQ